MFGRLFIFRRCAGDFILSPLRLFLIWWPLWNYYLIHILGLFLFLLHIIILIRLPLLDLWSLSNFLWHQITFLRLLRLRMFYVLSLQLILTYAFQLLRFTKLQFVRWFLLSIFLSWSVWGAVRVFWPKDLWLHGSVWKHILVWHMASRYFLVVAALLSCRISFFPLLLINRLKLRFSFTLYLNAIAVIGLKVLFADIGKLLILLPLNTLSSKAIQKSVSEMHISSRELSFIRPINLAGPLVDPLM